MYSPERRQQLFHERHNHFATVAVGGDAPYGTAPPLYCECEERVAAARPKGGSGLSSVYFKGLLYTQKTLAVRRSTLSLFFRPLCESAKKTLGKVESSAFNIVGILPTKENTSPHATRTTTATCSLHLPHEPLVVRLIGNRVDLHDARNAVRMHP